MKTCDKIITALSLIVMIISCIYLFSEENLIAGLWCIAAMIFYFFSVTERYFGQCWKQLAEDTLKTLRDMIDNMEAVNENMKEKIKQ